MALVYARRGQSAMLNFGQVTNPTVSLKPNADVGQFLGWATLFGTTQEVAVNFHFGEPFLDFEACIDPTINRDAPFIVFSDHSALIQNFIERVVGFVSSIISRDANRDSH